MPNFEPISNLRTEPLYSFADAPNLRHRAWSAGLDPAYWYPVEWDHALRPAQVVEVLFSGRSVALFRGEDGQLSALDNRCAHRQVTLSFGDVKDCQLACPYHGWTYDRDGTLTRVGHELFGGSLPKVKLRSYPVQVKYGLIWIFFGDRELMSERPMPAIAELDANPPWVTVPLDFEIACHPTAIINNVMDSTHVASLHRTFRTRSLIYGKVSSCESEGDSVRVSHEIEMDPGGLLRFMVNPLEHGGQTATYQYPYLRVSVGGVYGLWNFMLPMGPRKTRLFLLAISDRMKIPFTPWLVPHRLIDKFMPLAKEGIARPLFAEDVWSVEAEQQGYDSHHASPSIDPHPAVHRCYELTVRKWEEHLARATPAKG